MLLFYYVAHYSQTIFLVAAVYDFDFTFAMLVAQTVETYILVKIEKFPIVQSYVTKARNFIADNCLLLQHEIYLYSQETDIY